MDRQLQDSEELRPTTEDIIQECNRFRILAIGKSGAGKSSLINRVFGINSTNVSHGSAGESDIDKEFSSDQNPRFVLHDSQGFEPGEINNFGIVKDFINRRSNAERLEDRLHAIWLCVAIPHAGGRVFEQGDEDFLQLDLGEVPVIVVFTKYDVLVSVIEQEVDENLDDEEVIEEFISQGTDAAFRDICIHPLERVRHLPYAKVSTMSYTTACRWSSGSHPTPTRYCHSVTSAYFRACGRCTGHRVEETRGHVGFGSEDECRC